MMRRREFITLFGGAAWPLVARAQQAPTPVIGFLHSASLEARRDQVVSFRRGLSETGYVEGHNLMIEYRWAEGQYDRLPGLATDLVRRSVAVIFAGSLPAVLAARAATTTIPIVFTVGGDPVRDGLVSSLNRPGGNATGASLFFGELVAKRLELLRELVPGVTAIAVLLNPNNPNASTRLENVQAAARTSRQRVHVFNAKSESEIDSSFAAFVQLGVWRASRQRRSFFESQRVQLLTLAARHAVPAIYDTRDYTTAGGLMSYGASFADAYRRAGIYVGRILKGEKPADLPVVQPTKFELAVNLKTAKALGLDRPGQPPRPRRRGDRIAAALAAICSRPVLAHCCPVPKRRHVRSWRKETYGRWPRGQGLMWWTAPAPGIEVP